MTLRRCITSSSQTGTPVSDGRDAHFRTSSDRDGVRPIACSMSPAASEPKASALAAHGYQVTASDLSEGAVDRARKEASARGLDVVFSVCDMRNAFSHHGGGFDVVICCDNSIPHLLDDSNIATALGQMLACLRPGGGCIVTVRDYDREPRGKCLLKPVQCSTRDDVRHIVTQVWDFDDDGTHYNFAMYVTEERISSRVVATRAMYARYYAIGTEKLMALIEGVGFEGPARLDEAFYQPMLVASKPD